MTDDSHAQAATCPDLSRQVATGDQTEYSLSIEEALALYDASGLPRTPRSIQRYCAKGDLDAHRIETPFGEKFLITPASVDRHIAYINEVRLVATTDDTESFEEKPATEAATEADRQRQGATSSDMSTPVAPQAEAVSQPVGADSPMVELLKSENAFLREQIKVKDQQIAEQSERSRETNLLIGGLQKMLTPLLGGADRPHDHYREKFTDQPPQQG